MLRFLFGAIFLSIPFVIILVAKALTKVVEIQDKEMFKREMKYKKKYTNDQELGDFERSKSNSKLGD